MALAIYEMFCIWDVYLYVVWVTWENPSCLAKKKKKKENPSCIICMCETHLTRGQTPPHILSFWSYFSGVMMLNLLALDLPEAGVEITEREVFFSKGGGVRFLRYLLSAFNMYLTPVCVVYSSELRPNREQLIRFETILEGKYIQLLFFPYIFSH